MRASSADKAAARAEWRVRWLSWCRLGAALVVGLAIIYGTRGGSSIVARVAGAIGFGAFIILIHFHLRAQARAQRAGETAAARRAGIPRCTCGRDARGQSR